MKKLLSVKDILLPQPEKNRRRFLHNMGITLAFLAASGLFCLVVSHGGYIESAVPLVFVLAVLLTALLTDGYFYGIFASFISVIAVNYAFTYPYFAFNFTLSGYPFTFLTMFTVTVVVGMLTEQNKRHNRLKAQANQEKIKANLLRSVSHDLRTPLTSIIGSTTAILENYDAFTEEDKRELIINVRDDAQWLVHLVENILSITRIQDGVVQIRKSPEAAEEIAAEVLTKFRKKYSMPVHIHVPDELLMVPMDATLIEQVLINLLENVVVHARNATQISITVEREGDMARFSVADDGVGLDENVLPRLFEEPFPHARDTHADGSRCMGIGLSACMSIVRAHGGTMSARNLPGSGAQISLVLPIKEENHGC